MQFPAELPVMHLVLVLSRISFLLSAKIFTDREKSLRKARVVLLETRRIRKSERDLNFPIPACKRRRNYRASDKRVLGTNCESFRARKTCVSARTVANEERAPRVPINPLVINPAGNYLALIAGEISLVTWRIIVPMDAIEKAARGNAQGSCTLSRFVNATSNAAD